MASEQFSLCWDNFHKNMSNGMNDLLECEDLVDVTLAIEGKYLKAHKMVLSVCSPYFKELFKTNPCQHPIVFMKDVTYEAMSDLLQFMYQGEVQVSQENLSTFIKTAEALQIKGLTGDGNGSNDADTSETTTSAEKPRQVESYKPTIKAKKQAASPMSSTPVPQAKRTRLSVSSNESRERTVSKVEVSSNLSDFKMEPYEQQQQEQQMMVEDVTEEGFDDTTLDETGGDEIGGDDGDDYSMIESASGREEEPKASTSGDGVAEGQELKSLIKEGIVIHNGFNYHRNTVKKCGNRHFICSEYKKLACRARLVLSANKEPNDFVLTGEHNHPPNADNVLRDMFVKELKLAVKLQPERQLREIFDIVASAYLSCSQRRSTNCKARAYIPINCTSDDLVVAQPHSHPPDHMIERKAEIWNTLKMFSESLPGKPLQVYSSVVSIYPETEKLFPFNHVEASIRGFRSRIKKKL